MFPSKESYVSFDFSSQSLEFKIDNTLVNMLHIKFKSGSGGYNNADLAVTPTTYKVGSCGTWVTFVNPVPYANGIWTLTYTTTSLLLMFENEQVYARRFIKPAVEALQDIK